jgi:heme O synthase-like polyprenyltransferase
MVLVVLVSYVNQEITKLDPTRIGQRRNKHTRTYHQWMYSFKKRKKYQVKRMAVTKTVMIPIKCGAVTIGIITVFVTAILFTWYFFLFLNEYIHWWYVLVALFLLCPILVGSSFVISWFT